MDRTEWFKAAEVAGATADTRGMKAALDLMDRHDHGGGNRFGLGGIYCTS